MTRQSRLHYCKTERYAALALSSYPVEPRKIGSLTCENEVWAAAEPDHGDDIGEQAPDGFDDPRRVRDALVELGRRRLHALHVLPVVRRGDSADGVADALAGAVDGDDREHEAPVQLAGQPPQPPAGGRDTAFATVIGGCFLELEGAVLPVLHLSTLSGAIPSQVLLADLERSRWNLRACERNRLVRSEMRKIVTGTTAQKAKCYSTQIRAQS